LPFTNFGENKAVQRKPPEQMQDEYRRERLGPLIFSPEASKPPKAAILWSRMEQRMIE
jgi:hypothetical protein